MDFQKRYEFDPKLDLLGKGVFSRVYKATDILLERTVALKFFTADASSKYQILGKIKKLIRLDHPNLRKYYDVALLSNENVLGETEHVVVTIMEYLEGGDFKSYIKAHPQYTDKLLVDILKGLSYLHKRGTIYRNLRPENILIKLEDDEPVAKIIDFEISRLSDLDENNSIEMLGTVEYMPPEHFNPKRYGVGGQIATNLDLWSFGLLVYEIVSNHKLFGGKSDGTSEGEIIANILYKIPLAQVNSLPVKYKEIVNKCLNKDASERVQHATELIALFGKDGAHTDFPKKHPSKTNSSNGHAIKPEPNQTRDGAPRIKEILPVQKFPEEPVRPRESNPVHSNGTAANIGGPYVSQPKDLLNDREKPRIPEVKKEAIRNESARISPGINPVDKVADISANRTRSETPAVTNPDADPAPANTDSELRRDPPKVRIATPLNRPKVDKKKIARQRLQKIALVILVAALVVAAAVYIYNNYYEPSVAGNKGPKPPAEITAIQIPEMIKVDGGAFQMGSDSRDALENSRPVHTVNLGTFFISKNEITVRQFAEFITDTKFATTADQLGYSWIYNGEDWVRAENINWTRDNYGKLISLSDMDLPVIHVSWMDAVSYCEWLSKRTNQQFRLPTEAEWEYAARGGNKSRNYVFSGSNSLDKVGWFRENSKESMRKVGQKQGNELGIFDMSGNVMEWCQDYYSDNYYASAKPENPAGPATGTEKVARGGSWFTQDLLCRSSFRMAYPETSTGGNIGFRICRTVK
jgi:formylglycine-generating enzyme required for sulfatase activity/serine/threonine protein kinase